MYQLLKKAAYTLVPKKLLFEHEVFFRSIFAFHLRGKNHECTVCGKGIKRFIKIPADLLCPFCGSRSRTRRLYSLLHSNNLLHGKVLHFSPSRSVYRLLKKNPSITYFSTDYEAEFIAEHKYDITQIPLGANIFDLIICYHILEHIEDDRKAMTELHRVLKSNGTCIIQTPFKTGKTFEDASIKTPKARLKAFGQEDHVRVYSVAGLQERLKESGFKNVEINTFPENERYGFVEETILISKK
ncbi:class I SAM-dependent methyltransferase [Aequorivita flava]